MLPEAQLWKRVFASPLLYGWWFAMMVFALGLISASTGIRPTDLIDVAASAVGLPHAWVGDVATWLTPARSQATLIAGWLLLLFGLAGLTFISRDRHALEAPAPATAFFGAGVILAQGGSLTSIAIVTLAAALVRAMVRPMAEHPVLEFSVVFPGAFLPAFGALCAPFRSLVTGVRRPDPRHERINVDPSASTPATDPLKMKYHEPLRADPVKIRQTNRSQATSTQIYYPQNASARMTPYETRMSPRRGPAPVPARTSELPSTS